MTPLPLGDLLREAARLAPDRPLVADAVLTVTASEAYDHARRLGTVLAARGVPVGGRTGVVAGRDAALLRLVLGVMAAGRVPLVLDPGSPDADARLARARCDLVLDARAVRELADEVAAAAPSPLPRPGDDDVAYLMHTSGTTATAKAVAVTHGGLAAAAADWAHVFGRHDAGGGALQLAGSGFDVFYSDLVRAVAGRHRLLVCPDATRLDPAAVVALLRTERIEVVDVTPAVARLLVDEVEADGSGLPDLRVLILGGEAWRVGELRRLRRVLPGCRVFNTYGLVETTVDNVGHEILGDLAGLPDEAVVPLGRPYPGCAWSIGAPGGTSLGASHDPPTEGELWLGGPYVAAGYLDGDGQVDPSAFRHGGERWFATGDLVRRDADGVLHYLGRAGSKVKLHGTRVDLDEVDAVLAAHPGVADVATVLVDGPEQVLAAVYVPRSDVRSEVSPGALRARAAAALGPLATPALVLERDALPLSPNGKVDRRSLASWARTRWEETQREETQREETQWEETQRDAVRHDPLDLLRDHCERRLGVTDPDVDAPLADLGLDSLHVAQLLATLGRAFGRRLPVELVFAGATLRRLAEEVGRSEARAPVARASVRHRLSVAQQEILLHEALHDDPAAYVVPWAFRVRGELRPELVEAGLRAVVAAHEPLHSRYGWDADGWFAEPAPQATEVRLVRLDAATAPDPAQLVTERFDLAAEPPVRAWWVAGPAADEALVVLAVHHVAIDGGGGQVLLDELGRAVADLASGRAPRTEAPVPRYGDVVGAAPADDTADVAYWRSVLSGFRPPADRTPAARAGRTPTGPRATRATAELDAQLTAAVRRLATDEGTTPFGVLLTAVAECERRWTGADDVLVGYPVSRRESPWTRPLVGLLVDTAVLRSRGTGRTGGRAALRATQRTLRENASHLGGACSAAQRELSRGSGRPAFGTWLNYLGPRDRPPVLPGAETEVVELAAGPAIFPRSIYVTDDGATLRLDGVFTPGFSTALAADQLEQVRRVVEHLVAAPDAPVGDADAVTARARAGWESARLDPALGSRRRVRALDVHPEAVVECGGRAPSAAALLETVERAQHRAGELLAPDVHLLPVRRVPESLLGLVALLRRGGRVALWDPAQPAAWEDAYRAAVRGLPPPTASEYALPTSGTSGTPQPVVSDVETLLAVLDDCAEALDVVPGDRFVLTAGLAHDPLLRDVLLPLLVGGRLLVPEPEVAADPDRLLDAIVRFRPTVLNLTPQLGRLLAEAAGGRVLSGVRVAVVCGDVLTPGDVARLRVLLPGARVLHGYGLTQSPQLPSLWEVPAETTEVLVGPGRPGTAVVVLDAGGRPCALGQPGEIHLVSRVLATGADAVPVGSSWPDDVAPVVGARPLRRLRTGDLGEPVGDGCIRFLGRAGSRASVDGEIVDPRAVEAVLAADDDVADVAVDVGTDPRGDCLVAVVAVRPGVAAGLPLEMRLRQQVRRRLPSAFVPREVLLVEQVPRGVNGKVDLEALRSLEAPPRTLAGRPPRTPTERAVGEIWQLHLGRGDLPAEENFFDLGGSSMLLLRVHRTMALRWGDACPDVLTCYERPTVADMAAHIDAAHGADPAGPELGVRVRRSRVDERRRRSQARAATGTA